MKSKRGYLILLLSVILVIFISGCAQQESEIPLSVPEEIVEEATVILDESPPIEGEANNLTDTTPSQQAAPQTTVQMNQTPEIKEVIPEIIKPQFDQVWQDRIDAAMASSYCLPVQKITYPDGYYTGPLTDTHLHIPEIPEWSADEKPSADELEGRFGGPGAFLGLNVKMSEIACTLKHEGTHKNFAFFPGYEGEMMLSSLYIWKQTMEIYPELFTPFIMSSGDDDDPNGYPTVDAKTLKSMLAVYPDLFEGYGEIGLYEREDGAAELPPDSKRLQDIYPIIRQHNLVVYFHLGEGHKSNFERVLKQYPNINFVWHGDQLSIDEVEDVLSKHPNAYYGVDAFWGNDQNLFHMFVGKSKEAYLNELDAKFNKVLGVAVSDWKSAIERHPDQFIWGIDRGDAVWNYDLDVGQAQVELARAFIGKLNPAVQEKFAYKNAERLIAGQ